MNRKDWVQAIGMAAALGCPDLAYKLNLERIKAGFGGPIDWNAELNQMDEECESSKKSS